MSDEQNTTPPTPEDTPPEAPQEQPAGEHLEEQPQEAAESPAGRYVPVAEAAEHLGLSARTVRRRIDAGDLQAKRADHSHAWLVWIEGLPEPPAGGDYQNVTEHEAKESAEQGSDESAGDPTPTTEQTVATLPVTTETVHALTDLVADLTLRNEALSMELGAYRERVRQLEGQLQALPVGEMPEPVKPWWKRFLGIN